jgi:hypothetical protein
LARFCPADDLHRPPAGDIFQYVTQGNFGLSDPAELFVFLSGASVALAYGL